ncbi:MAG: hypothetical protein EOP86_12930 [Verrucomicrobiaceae bacterium]|nr:MAG: hypothetical protein EOP86_12930 [Verrucomicrobiaceae bacterium]
MQTGRSATLQRFGFTPETVDQVLRALGRELPEVCPEPSQLSLGNEIFVPDWIGCCLEASRRSPVEALREMLFELNFPIAAGISGTPEYQSLALAGSSGLEDVRSTLPPQGPAWSEPDKIRVFMHDSGAGLLPVIHAASHADFVILLQAIVHRNEPVPVPLSTGSSFINGYSNRGRYLRIREALALGVLAPEARNPQLWKDKILLLASGPYSGVPASALGLDPEKWLERSTRLRIHHEACHYLNRRLFPKLKFGLQDELIADFAGLMEATGGFKAAEFLLFMGLERFPDYRAGGRLENYPRELGGNAEVTHAVARLLVEAAANLERFFSSWDPIRYVIGKLRVLALLTWLPLEILAGPDACGILGRLLNGADGISPPDPGKSS